MCITLVCNLWALSVLIINVSSDFLLSMQNINILSGYVSSVQIIDMVSGMRVVCADLEYIAAITLCVQIMIYNGRSRHSVQFIHVLWR